ncbi:MAG: 30S ribosomal protein S8 [Mycoplasmoidaceae bacterium]
MYIDPISDCLLRIKNATKSKKTTVDVRTSKLILGILSILKDEGYIRNFETKEISKGIKITSIALKYKNNISSILGMRQISKPGLRIYQEANKLPLVLNGLGVAIISTSQGLLTSKEARKKSVGGEVLAYVW